MIGKAITETVVQTNSVVVRTPFQYPGGKTWFVPHTKQWLGSLPIKPELLIEPFAGGATVGLNAAFYSLAGGVVLNELDAGVSAVWRVIAGGGGLALARRFEVFTLNVENVKRVLEEPPEGLAGLAFATLLKNRVVYNGILLNGGLSKNLSSRCNLSQTAAKIRALHYIRHRIEATHGCAFACIQKYAKRKGVVYFVDPPYMEAGKSLYLHGELDHERVFRELAKVVGSFVLTYDNVEATRQWAKQYGFDTEPMLMQTGMNHLKNATKVELLIGRDLNWARVRKTRKGLFG